MDISHQDHLFLQIAWKAGTLGLSKAGSKRIKRHTIMAFDVPKLCQLVNNKLSLKSLTTRACLLCGASTIMRQQSNILYDDTIQLYKLLELGFTHPDKRPNIDLEKPFASLQAITIQNELESFFEFTSSHTAPSFSDLFVESIHRSHKRDRDLYDLEESLSSVLHISDITEQQDFVIAPHEPFNEGVYQDMIDFDFSLGDGDMMIDPIMTEKRRDNEKEHTPSTNDVNLSSTSPLLTADSPVHHSPHPSSISHSPASYGRDNDLPRFPPLIPEEEEEGVLESDSIASMSTDLYASILPQHHPSQLVVSPVPPDRPRPRAVKRMMLRRTQDTILPSECYQRPDLLTAQPVITTHHPKDMRYQIRHPSLATLDKIGAGVKHLLFPNRTIDKGYQQVERPRRFDRRRDALGSSPSTASSSFLGGIAAYNIHTPEFQSTHFDLGDDSHMTLIHEAQNEWPLDNAQFDYENHADIDYGYLDFNHQFNLEEEEINRFLENRSEVSKSFSYVLELASKGKIKATQHEPYGPIDIELLTYCV
ncbi:hypothetical protein A0J61_01839 [Choanephora cucurbitarum]|uniref:Rad21/Rec8-like protein N-terminal domain-containing protein n=1 Tax=Choanephora cucurbitarum TaxID=101091 RepID=A0A1C7NLT6_9FUNG|nr:hypothetical protein A0J61_01839 [Choanephora cucurbitarum]